jgi:hypothetical protein
MYEKGSMNFGRYSAFLGVTEPHPFSLSNLRHEKESESACHIAVDVLHVSMRFCGGTGLDFQFGGSQKIQSSWESSRASDLHFL